MKGLYENSDFTYGEYVKILKQFKAEYEDFKLYECGNTLMNRKIYAVVLGNGKERVLYAGGGGKTEKLTSLLLVRFAQNLCCENKNNGEICGYSVGELFERCTLVIVPEINPDGANSTVTGKNTFDEIFKSEPENTAMIRLCRKADFNKLLVLRSGSEEIFWDFGKNTPKKSLLQAKMMSAVSDYTMVKYDEPASPGFENLFVNIFKRPAFTVKAGTKENPLSLSEFDKAYSRLRALLVTGIII